VGVAVVVGYAVFQRNPEIGLRIALGAQTRDICSAIMGQGVRLTAIGLLVGLIGAFAASRALVFGVSPSDPLTYLGASLLLVSIAPLAIWFPARRALRVDPVKVLDAE
jgi:ABC-type antimicrobial peptide transport system permease subunit